MLKLRKTFRLSVVVIYRRIRINSYRTGRSS